MLLLFIIGILLGAVSVMFSLQNVAVVTVSFFKWQLHGSLAVILLLAITSGILICLLILLPGTLQTAMRLRSLKKTNKKLEEELKRQKEMRVFADHSQPTRNDIENIEKGVIRERESLIN